MVSGTISEKNKRNRLFDFYQTDRVLCYTCHCEFEFYILRSQKCNSRLYFYQQHNIQFTNKYDNQDLR